MRSVALEPFEDMVLRSARAGHHDGTKSVVGLDHTHDVLVQRHEWVHGQLFTSTPDGQLLAALLRLYGVDTAPLGITPARLDTTARDMIGRSRTAQEAAATYLSVKMHEPAQQPALLEALDAEYRQYFAVMADAIDGWVGSSYLQYLVAWNVALMALSSRYLARFVADPAAADLQTRADEQPDQRLVLILGALRQQTAPLRGLIDLTFRAACHARSVAHWDPHDEQGWVALREHQPSVIQALEADVTLQLRPAIVRLSGLPVLLDAEHRHAFEQLDQWLRKAGASAGRMTDADWRAHDAEAWARIDAHNQAAAELRVPGARPLARRADAQPWNLTDARSSFLFVEDEDAADGPWHDRATLIERLRSGDEAWLHDRMAARPWNGFAWHDRPWEADASETRAVNQGELVGWLEARRRQPQDACSPVVVVTRASDDLHFMSQHTLLYELLGVDRGTQEPGATVLPLCHYLEGNWFTWFDRLRWLRAGFSPGGPWKVIAGNVPLARPAAGTVVLHLLWHGVLGASFFRLTTPHASERMMPEFERLLQLPDVEAMNVAEARMLRPLYEKIVIPGVLACWSRL